MVSMFVLHSATVSVNVWWWRNLSAVDFKHGCLCLSPRFGGLMGIVVYIIKIRSFVLSSMLTGSEIDTEFLM